MSILDVTSREVISKISQGEPIELPPFVNGQPFVARLRSASLIGLASAGVIPNPLIAVAEGLFNGRISDVGKESSRFKETAEMFHIVAENALVEPTLADLNENGIMLTDMQYLAIFNYSQMGAKALAGFRGKQTGSEGDIPSGALPGDAKQDAGHN